VVGKRVLGLVVGVEGDGGTVRRRQACAVERQGRGAANGHVGRALAPSKVVPASELRLEHLVLYALQRACDLRREETR